MNTRPAVLFVALFAGLIMSTNVAADDAKELIGVWEVTKGVRAGTTYEFTKDGKLKVNEKDSKAAPLVGTYKVMGKELTFSITFGDKTEKQTITIEKITDKQLILLDAEKKEMEFNRVE